MLDDNKCDICGQTATQKCGGCHNIFYCGKNHQKEGWKNHKKLCKPFKICENEILGRHLVATKSLKFGDIIIRENPLVWGPAQITAPVCLGCNTLISNANSTPCSKCGWPMCCKLCEKSPAHIPECRYTIQRGDKVSIKNFGVIHPTYQSITVLRCLYRKEFLKETWNKINFLMANSKKKHKTIVDFIRKFFKLDIAFSEDEVEKICGILQINGHEVPLTDPSYIALYEFTSYLEHSCQANCTKSFTNQGEILITAGTNIEKGDHLSICYTDPLWGTTNRRNHLFESKNFRCECIRCSDITEFGTYFNAIKCQNNNNKCNGYLLPKTFLIEESSSWNCTECSNSKSSDSVSEFLDRIGKDLSQMPKNDPEACKKFLKHYGNYLHSNHYYMIDVKLALITQLGIGTSKMKISEDDLCMKLKTCKNLDELVRKLAPAEKRIRGLILFELQETLAEIGRRRGDPEELQTALLECKNVLTNCVEFLKNEPTRLSEGKICEQARNNLKEIDVLLRVAFEANKMSPI